MPRCRDTEMPRCPVQKPDGGGSPGLAIVPCSSPVWGQPQAPEVFPLETACLLTTNHQLLKINFQPKNPTRTGGLSGFTLSSKGRAETARR